MGHLLFESKMGGALTELKGGLSRMWAQRFVNTLLKRLLLARNLIDRTVTGYMHHNEHRRAARL
jgi:predicted DNA-binding transcriptional regulator